MKRSNIRGEVARRGAGFTIVELLVVVTIMGALMGMGAWGFQHLTASRGVGGGVGMASIIFQATRMEAIAKGKRARVLINNDSNSRAKYLRLMLTLVESQTEAGLWERNNAGVYLPEGVCFYPEQSSVEYTMNFDEDAPSPAGEGGGANWYYYEFDGQGQLTGSRNSRKFSLVTGRLESREGTFELVVSEKDQLNGFDGFMVFKLGRPVLFRNPEEARNAKK